MQRKQWQLEFQKQLSAVQQFIEKNITIHWNSYSCTYWNLLKSDRQQKTPQQTKNFLKVLKTSWSLSPVILQETESERILIKHKCKILASSTEVKMDIL